MRNAKTILQVIQERGRMRLPLARVYRLLYNPNLYLLAYARIARNDGALTPGVTQETADGMCLVDTIQHVIEALRVGRYRWTPVRRVYIEKKGSTTRRPLGIPTWTDKLLQEVLRLLLEAYYELQLPVFSWVPRGTWMPYGLAGHQTPLEGYEVVHRGRHLPMFRQSGSHDHAVDPRQTNP